MYKNLEKTLFARFLKNMLLLLKRGEELRATFKLPMNVGVALWLSTSFWKYSFLINAIDSPRSRYYHIRLKGVV